VERQDAQRQILRDKADMYYWRTRDAYQGGDYQEALKWALKKLKLNPGDDRMTRVALSCAIKANDKPVALMLMTEAFRDGRMEQRDDFLVLAKGAVSSKVFTLAQEVLETLWADLTSNSPKLFGRFSKAKLKEVEQLLLYSRSMAALPAGPVYPSPGPPAPGRTPAEERVAHKGGRDQLTPAQAEAAQQEEPLPELGIVFEAAAGPLLDPLPRSNSSPAATLPIPATESDYGSSSKKSWCERCRKTIRKIQPVVKDSTVLLLCIPCNHKK